MPDPETALNPVFENCKALTFDLFGTVLDLGGSLTPHLKVFLDGRGSDLEPAAMWRQLRYRQRIEQYQDTLVELGHSGYLETVQKAFVYVARANKLDPSARQVETFMSGWQELSPFPECVAALDRLRTRYKLVALSNGNPWFLEHLVKNRIKYDFDGVISVEEAGYFKPKPGVYRRAARNLGAEPGELIMVSANSCSFPLDTRCLTLWEQGPAGSVVRMLIDTTCRSRIPTLCTNQTSL